MVKSERYPTMNRVRHMLREARRFARYMNPVHTDKRFLMKLRALKLERSAKEVGELEDKFLHALMIAERDNTLTTVEEVWGSVEDEDYFDRIVIQNKDGEILYYGDRSAGIPEKFENACVDHAGLNEDREVVITLAGKK